MMLMRKRGIEDDSQMAAQLRRPAMLFRCLQLISGFALIAAKPDSQTLMSNVITDQHLFYRYS
jgi:hypothetical protein